MAYPKRQRSRAAAPYEVRVNGVRVSSHWSEAAAWRAWERAIRQSDTVTCQLTQWLAPMYDTVAVLGDHAEE